MDLHGIWGTLRALGGKFWAVLPELLIAILVFAIFVTIAAMIKRIVASITSQYKHAYNVGIVLGRLAYGITLLVGILVAVSVVAPSFKAADIVQILGIGGVAVGFAFREILQNFLAGILLLLTEPFRIRDQIVIKEFEGTVEAIETRATTIRTYDGRRVVIPNADLFTNPVIVNTAFEKRRSEYDVGIGYGDDIERARRLMVEAARSIDGVLDDPAPEALVIDLADFSIKIRLLWWTAPPNQLHLLENKDKVLAAVREKLGENGIDLPYPTRQILFHDQTEATDGNRAEQREGWPAGDGRVPRSRSIAEALLRSQSEAGNGQQREDRAA